MRTTATWAFFRRLQYGTLLGSILVLFGWWFYVNNIYVAPTCFDGLQAESESGVDCGGVCTRICPFAVEKPQVKWARSFKINDGQYNAVAYIENINRTASTPEMEYIISLYDDDGLITQRKGSTFLPPDSVYPVFEGRIFTDGRTPTRTLIDVIEPVLWLPVLKGRDQFTIVDRTLSGADTRPRLDAVVENENLTEVREVEVVATIFDANGNALTSSQTYVENFAPQSKTDIVFTWPEPIAKTLRSCEVPTDVLVAVDLSGSMNDDGGTPPQPVSSVKDAAAAFVSRLGQEDRVSIVTFATDATIAFPLSSNKTVAVDVVRQLAITPEAEVGSTNTGEAMKVGGFELVSVRHNNDARKVMVILTDGLATAPAENPEEYALYIANELRKGDIEVYAIGLGENVNMDFVRTIATTPEYAYQAISRQDVDRIYRTITGSICEDGAAVIDIIPKTEASFEPWEKYKS